MKIKALLKRTGLEKLPEKNLEGLSLVMNAISASIPFENLDVHLGRKISLDRDSIATKLLKQNRGGYCYEINGLLYHLLKDWGLDPTLLGARTILGYQGIRPITHMLLKVSLPEGTYLCDLGFTGLCPTEPLPLDTGKGNQQKYRLRTGDSPGYILEGKDALEQWISLYSFEDRPLQEVDFLTANYYNNHSSDSICTQQVICAIQKKGTLIRLVQNTLKIRSRDGEEKVNIEDAEQLAAVLKKHFGIHLKPWETEVIFHKCASAS